MAGIKSALVIDTKSLEASIAAVTGKLDKAIVKGLNNSAFKLREIWLKLISDKIKSPVKFTQRVFVTKAAPNKLEAVTFMPGIQSEYLRYMIGGDTRKPGEIGALKSTILVPAGVKLDKYGNFKYGPKRFLGTLEEKNKGAFVGATRGGKSKAVLQKKRDGSVKLLAVFQKLVDYKPTLPIDKVAEGFGDEANKIFQEALKGV